MGILSSYIINPLLEAIDTSKSAPKSPPSVISCIELTLYLEAIFPSFKTLI